MSVMRLTHVGVCVRDLERSLRFYCEGLGFRERSRLEVAGDAVDTLLELSDTRLRAVYLERDGVVLELLHFDDVAADDAPRPMNRTGLTHLSFRVDDLDAALAGLVAAGGAVLEGTRTENPEFGAGAVFATDPDGTRIELVRAPGPPDVLPGEAR